MAFSTRCRSQTLFELAVVRSLCFSHLFSLALQNFCIKNERFLAGFLQTKSLEELGFCSRYYHLCGACLPFARIGGSVRIDAYLISRFCCHKKRLDHHRSELFRMFPPRSPPKSSQAFHMKPEAVGGVLPGFNLYGDLG